MMSDVLAFSAKVAASDQDNPLVIYGDVLLDNPWHPPLSSFKNFPRYYSLKITNKLGKSLQVTCIADRKLGC